jgi:hypothetical protein
MAEKEGCRSTTKEGGMTLLTKKEMQEIEVIAGFACDKCGAEWDAEQIFEMQERISISFIGGYASVWGDMNKVEIDLCQDCSLEMFQDIARASTSG